MEKQVSSKPPKFVWNAIDKKFCVCVVSATGLTGNKIEPVVKIQSEKKKLGKTQSVRSFEPVWEKFFFFNTLPTTLLFIVKDGKKHLGQCELHTTGLVSDVVREYTMSLKPKKEKNAGMKLGELVVRVLFSSSPDQRELYKPSDAVLRHYFYNQHVENFKTGDLILYSGTSPIDAMIKLKTGTLYSHVGIILKIASPITNIQQLYVAEVTRNIDKMIDAWHQGIANGVTVFRLEERIHQYFGNAMWWVPLKKPISLSQEQNMLSWISDIHFHEAQNSGLVIDPVLTNNQTEFLRYFNISTKYPKTLTELWSPIFVLNCLERGNVVTSQTEENGDKKSDLAKSTTPEVALNLTDPDIYVHSYSTDDKKLLYPSSLILPIYEVPVLIFCLTSCLTEFKVTGGESEEFRTHPHSIFEATTDWNKPFQLTAKIKNDIDERRRRVEEMIKSEEAVIQKLDEGSESGSEILNQLDDDVMSIEDKMIKDPKEELHEPKVEESEIKPELKMEDKLEQNPEVNIEEKLEIPSEVKTDEKKPELKKKKKRRERSTKETETANKPEISETKIEEKSDKVEVVAKKADVISETKVGLEIISEESVSLANSVEYVPHDDKISLLSTLPTKQISKKNHRTKNSARASVTHSAPSSKTRKTKRYSTPLPVSAPTNKSSEEKE